MADDIEVLVLNALTPVLDNAWSVELPEHPTFPALVFEVETEIEQGWPAKAGYARHGVQVFILAETKAEVKALLRQVETAMSGVEGFLLQGESGDADYEDAADVYAYYADSVIRVPLHVVND